MLGQARHVGRRVGQSLLRVIAAVSIARAVQCDEPDPGGNDRLDSSCDLVSGSRRPMKDHNRCAIWVAELNPSQFPPVGQLHDGGVDHGARS